jgi:hypothetical protein
LTTNHIELVFGRSGVDLVSAVGHGLAAAGLVDGVILRGEHESTPSAFACESNPLFRSASHRRPRRSAERLLLTTHPQAGPLPSSPFHFSSNSISGWGHAGDDSKAIRSPKVPPG